MSGVQISPRSKRTDSIPTKIIKGFSWKKTRSRLSYIPSALSDIILHVVCYIFRFSKFSKLEVGMYGVQISPRSKRMDSTPTKTRKGFSWKKTRSRLSYIPSALSDIILHVVCYI